MSIKAYIQELEGVKSELRKLSAQRKILKKRQEGLETSISEYLESKDQPGLKYNGMAFVVEEKTTKSYKKQKDKDNDSLEVLKSAGIQSPEKLLTRLLEARTGDPVVKEKLKIKKIKE